MDTCVIKGKTDVRKLVVMYLTIKSFCFCKGWAIARPWFLMGVQRLVRNELIPKTFNSFISNSVLGQILYESGELLYLELQNSNVII